MILKDFCFEPNYLITKLCYSLMLILLDGDWSERRRHNLMSLSWRPHRGRMSGRGRLNPSPRKASVCSGNQHFNLTMLITKILLVKVNSQEEGIWCWFLQYWNWDRKIVFGKLFCLKYGMKTMHKISGF